MAHAKWFQQKRTKQSTLHGHSGGSSDGPLMQSAASLLQAHVTAGDEREVHTRSSRTSVDILPFHQQSAGPTEVRFINRELSWLQFNERVLTMAEDASVPLLERVRFLAIFAGNLDEFFQVRVAGLCEQVAAGATGTNADYLTPAAQLRAIREIVETLTTRADEIFLRSIVPALRSQGLTLITLPETNRRERRYLARYFEEHIFPVLTPLAVDPAHPFPYISNLSLSLAVLLESEVGRLQFARVKVPQILPRFVQLPGTMRFIALETLIASHLDRLFPGVRIIEHHMFRITRNADLDVESSDAEDLLLAIRSKLNRQRFGRAVRLEVSAGMTDVALRLLLEELSISESEVEVSTVPLGLAGLRQFADLDRSDLQWPPFQPQINSWLRPDGSDAKEAPNILSALRERDVLLHHPYDSFATSVQAFLEEAANDPKVLAIKIALYRTSGPGSPIVRALIDAAESGKQVVALIELKARFDEEANITWATELERAGVHVAYGVVGLKTHAKVALVVRAEEGGLRRYVHIGTGNYNEATARIYEDIGLMSADPALGSDLTDLFNVLTGYGEQTSYQRLIVAPASFRPRITELIQREAKRKNGHIMIKTNALVDPAIIALLYEASQSGTQVDLLVRGICCLRPGVPGLSENIRVRSIVGRYLEHSRIYRFGGSQRECDLLIGSGDLMPRNLDRRIEVLVPVTSADHKARLEEILQVEWADDLLAWELGADLRWRRVDPVVKLDSHATLQSRSCLRQTFARSGSSCHEIE